MKTTVHSNKQRGRVGEVAALVPLNQPGNARGEEDIDGGNFSEQGEIKKGHLTGA
jgi:hypothetical protein